ncbi:hypothetical protein [Leptolyngbya sp. FACHB-16]|uniref:hypothetical protein n=1 Tax=unclassified Leptolyngbya TaxID=2650499 RepID=UPI0016881498|nr:hypothetical protein [Leptolyngbya sp. FACHB-16]MBD2156241.1 hypothetical protein [Leptolyngbya sp. FACHB-16]
MSKFGSLTLWEHLAVEGRLEELREDLADPVAAIAFAPLLNKILASILLVSRVRANYSWAEVEDLAPETIEAIADFLLSERRRWADPTIVTEPRKGSSDEPVDGVDWNEVYVRLATAMPGDPRWTPQKFQTVPLNQIEAAIATLGRVELQRASLSALPLALGFTYLLKAQGVKKIEVGDLEPYGRELRIQAEVAKLPTDAARILQELIDTNQCPQWAANMIEPEVLKRAAA